MPAIELIGCSVTAPSTTETTATAFTGNSLTTRAAASDSKNFLLSLWALEQTAGFVTVKSPLMHDNVKNFRFKSIAAKPWLALDPMFAQPIHPQDSIVVTMSGSGTAGDVEQAFLLNYYENLPGANARLQNWADVMNKMINTLTVPISITTTAGPGWTGAVALNSSQDLMKANTDYALLGYLTTTLGGAFGIYGTDTAGMRIGGPLDNTEFKNTATYFVDLAQKSGLPCIPIINSANKSNTYVDAAVDENATAQVLQLIFGELSGS